MTGTVENDQDSYQGDDDHEPVRLDPAVGHGLPGWQEPHHDPAAVQRRNGDQVEDCQKDIELDGDNQKQQQPPDVDPGHEHGLEDHGQGGGQKEVDHRTG